MEARMEEKQMGLASTDHDLLILIAQGQSNMQNDMRSMAEDLRQLRSAVEATNQRQNDLEGRQTNLSGTVQQWMTNQAKDHDEIQKIGHRAIEWDEMTKTVAEDHKKVGSWDKASELTTADHKKVEDLSNDVTRWKLYGKVIMVLGTPLYVGLLAVLIEAAKRFFWP